MKVLLNAVCTPDPDSDRLLLGSLLTTRGITGKTNAIYLYVFRDHHTDVLYSMIQFFVLDVLLSRVVAVSTDPAPDSAFAPSFFGRPAGQLPSSHGTMSCVSRQAKIIHPFLSACASPIAWRRG